jgi:uncharacterized protein GlcG (DUF336 family)
MRTLAAAMVFVACAAQAAEPTYRVKLLTPESALKAALAAQAACRSRGYQVTVAVVDRAGIAQVLLRDRFAGAHTIDLATAKAATAASFRMPTSELAEATQAGKPQSGIRNRPGVAAVGGGLTVQAGGALLAGIGVSGAPGGDEDEACARAGIGAIADDLDME